MKLAGKRTAVFYFEAIIVIFAIVLVIAGTSAHSNHSEWFIFMGLGLFVLAGVPALRAFAGPSGSDDLILERKTSGNKISNGLVALSSAAILIVYAAGYNRTSSAADQLAAQSASPRHRISASVVTASELPAAQLIENAAPIKASRPQQIAAGKLFASENAPIVATNSSVAKEDKPATAEISAPETVTPAQPEPAVAVAAAVVPEQPAAQPAPVQVAEVHQSPYTDGTYFGWGSCRHGSLQVKVVIEAGRIASADINECRTRYSCSVIKTAPPQVVSRQTPETIDNVSGATQSVDAYYFAVTEALKQAVRSTK